MSPAAMARFAWDVRAAQAEGPVRRGRVEHLRAVLQGARPGGLRALRGRHGGARARAGGADRAGHRAAGPDAARRGRPRRVPRPSPPQRRPDPDAHRARHGDRPHRRARARRRRLRRQAVQRRGGDRPHPRRPAALRRLPPVRRPGARGRRDGRRPPGGSRRPPRPARGRGAPAQPQGVRPADGADRPRRARGDARGPDGARVGRELVRLDQDARRAHPLAAPEARRRPGRAALPAHGPRRRLPLHRAGGVGMTLRGRLLLALAYILLLAIVALEVPLAISLRDRVDAEVRSQARSQADVVAATVAGNLDAPETLDETVRTAGEAVRGRVVVTDRAGALLADSAGTDRLGTDYGDRPEIASALRGTPVQDRRRSDTLDQEILATAVPVVERGTRVGVVRVTQSVSAVSRATNRATLGLAAIGLLVLGLGLAAGVVIARQIAGPLRRLDAAAARVAGGDLAARARVEGSAEQRSLAETFNGMTARLERLVAGQRDFVADASHQLRTPLAGLQLRLEEARAVTDDPEVHEEIDAGLAELDRLAAIISELLLLSQAGEVDAPPEPIDLDDAARRAAARHDGTEGARVEAVEAAAGAPAYCPAADLDRVLDALIENALRYGGGDITVVARPGGVEVLDRGPGLAREELDAVFERFHRGRAGRAGPSGTGLGLAIARELARRWGGEVELANRPDGGAAARITVPAPPRERERAGFPVS